MRRPRHPWILATIVVLAAVIVAVVILVAIGLTGARRRGYPGQSSPEFEIAVHGQLEEIHRIRTELEDAGYLNVPEHLLRSLSTLEKVDDYPIYTMTYEGPYLRASEFQEEYGTGVSAEIRSGAWGCSLFGAVGDPDWPMMGRNFDWEYSPILVVWLEPEEGYLSMMSIDLAYLISDDIVGRLDEVRADELIPLLSAPFLTFDGMNEEGLAIGMASVDYECDYPSDPDKRDVGDLRLMREVLENSATVDEAIVFLEGVNPVSQGGPNTHYLVTDTTPEAALIEYSAGEMYVFRSSDKAPWQLGTNFPVVLTDGNPDGICWRYDRIAEILEQEQGDLNSLEALQLLEQVSTPTTRWSIVYDLAKRIMYLSIERDLNLIYGINLETQQVMPQRATPQQH